VIPGAFNSAILYKMRELRYDNKFDIDDIATRCRLFHDHHHKYTEEETESILILLAAWIGNHLEEI
jgi:hypothetical protein